MLGFGLFHLSSNIWGGGGLILAHYILYNPS